VAYKSL